MGFLKIDSGTVKEVKSTVTGILKTKSASTAPVTAPSSLERIPLRDGIEIKNAAAKKIAEFSKISKTSTRNVLIDGKNVELTVFDDIKGTGSNKAFWAQKTGSSELFYIKIPENIQHAHNEVLASELYKLAGIPSADLKIVEFADSAGKLQKGIASSYMDFERGISTKGTIDSTKNIESFGIDSWLADWDSLTGSNTVVKDGKAIKLDVGGSLRFRAGGAPKVEKFGAEVNELVSIYNNKMGFYKGITHDDLLKSLEKVIKLSDEDIAKIVQKAAKQGLENPEEMTKTLLARKNYIKRFAQEMKSNPPLEGETSFSFTKYLERINKKTASQKVEATVIKPAVIKPAGIKPVKCLMSDELIGRTNEEQRRVLADLYENHYTRIAGKKIASPANDIIQEGALLHGSSYSKEVFESILKDGLISGDLGKNFHGAKCEKATIGGLDTFRADKKRSIKQYFEDWLPKRDGQSLNFERRPTMRDENTFLDLAEGGTGTKKIVFVINPNHPDLKPLMEHRVKSKYIDYRHITPNPEYNGLFAQLSLVDTYRGPNHHWVPVGIPSGYLEKIVVGHDITPEQVKEMKDLIRKYDLDTALFTTKGERL